MSPDQKLESAAHGAGERPVAIVTGVSREIGIGAAVARRLGRKHRLFLTGHAHYDASQPYDDGSDGVAGLMGELTASHVEVEYLPVDLSDPSGPAAVVRGAIDRFGRVDALVANHTYSVPTPLGGLDAAQIDTTLAVNVRATLLLIEHFVRARRSAGPQGRIVLMSSGQRLGPMPGELAYAASKGAMEAVLPTLADTLGTENVTINAVNPGPTDTGWATAETHEALRASFPQGRWGEPDDAARVVDFLVSDAARWLTGQIIDSEGGFRRWNYPAEAPAW